MIINILTLFPKMFQGPFSESMIKKALEKNLVKINIHDLREFGQGPRKQVDDRPYGGGIGMILMVEPLYKALRKIKTKNSKTILLTPTGTPFNQKIAQSLSKEKDLILVCGHYEGFDERIKNFVDEEVSIGDYVLTGGEIPAMAITDAVVRLIPGVLEEEATQKESFSENLLEYPQFSRPEEFQGKKVPSILLSGNHKEIEAWRKNQALQKTKLKRPDLIK